jgi:alkaline phosphatase D
MSGANTISDRECPQRWGPRNMLGTAQEQWLNASFAKQARWNIIGEQTLVSPLNQPADGEDRYYTEPWDGYPQARQRLIETLEKRHVANPVITGGDVHCTFAMDLHRNTRDPR